MSKKDTNGKNKEIREKKEAIPQLKEIAFKNWYRTLLRSWLISIGLLFLGMVSFGALIYFVPISPLFPISPLESSKIEEIAKSVLAPSVTINGLFITFIPVISFFYLQETEKNK